MKDYSIMVLKARIFSVKHHSGQYRRDGHTPYFSHPNAVAKLLEKAGYGPLFQTVAFLHDILENTNLSDYLLEQEFNKRVADIVFILTRQEDENYFDYIKRVKKNRVARIVKIYDLIHNLSDLEEGSMKDKYRFAKHFLGCKK